jgi:phage host-nuclease inhibitor protein Gam
MCEHCEDKEKQENILKSCAKCSTSIKSTEIENINREVTDTEAESKRIDEEMKKRHIELINGYDKQLEDCLRDIATFSTKMLIMFEDYKKKGKVDEIVKLLQSMANYAMTTQTTATVVVLTANMLVGKASGYS